jgi:WD40 repeat protein
MICEFDASTLKTVGAPSKHTSAISGLALSSDCVLLASSYYDNTIKLWAFESRQLLASFDVESPHTLVLSPDSRQLAYTTWNDTKSYICDIPANILASIESVCIPTYIHHLYANILTDQQI